MCTLESLSTALKFPPLCVAAAQKCPILTKHWQENLQSFAAKIQISQITFYVLTIPIYNLFVIWKKFNKSQALKRPKFSRNWLAEKCAETLFFLQSSALFSFTAFLKKIHHLEYFCTMLQKLSKCEFKAWLCRNLIILPHLRFYVKSTFCEFYRSKNVNFDNFRGFEFWF